jgi:tetratricopeptide (TPR) repeat protein
MLARAFLFLLVVGAAVYANHFQNAFQFDDFHSIVENPSIRRLDAWRSWFTDLGAFSVLPENLNYRPLLLASFALSYRISGPEVWGFHLLSWLVHVGAACLVFGIARRLFAATEVGRSPALPLALFAATLFLVHPVNAESVNYISSRSESLAACGVLLAFACFLAMDAARAAGRRIRTAGFAALSGLAFVAGLLTKEIAITFPALVVWYEIALGARPPSLAARLKRRWWYLAGLSIITFSYLAWRAALIPPEVVQARSSVERPTYFVTQIRAWAHYLREFIWPAGLHADNTDFGWSTTLFDPRVLLALAALAALAVLLVRFRRRVPIAAFGFGWFWIALWPAASVFPLAEPVNGHRAYLAGAGLAIAMADFARAVFAALAVSPTTQRRTLAVAIGVAVLVLGAATWKRNQVWHSPRSLWADTVAKSPGNGRAWMNLGLADLAAGDTAAAGRAFDAAVERAQHYGLAYVNRAIWRRVTGDRAGAGADTEASLRLAPENIFVRYWAARHYADEGNLARAAAELDRARALSPSHVECRLLAIEVEGRMGRGERLPEILAELEALGAATPEVRARAAAFLASQPAEAAAAPPGSALRGTAPAILAVPAPAASTAGP